MFAHSASYRVGAGPTPPIISSCSTLSHRTRSKDSNRCHAACLLISVDNGREASPQKLWLLVLKVGLVENASLHSLSAHDASQKKRRSNFQPNNDARRILAYRIVRYINPHSLLINPGLIIKTPWRCQLLGFFIFLYLILSLLILLKSNRKTIVDFRGFRTPLIRTPKANWFIIRVLDNWFPVYIWIYWN